MYKHIIKILYKLEILLKTMMEILFTWSDISFIFLLLEIPEVFKILRE